MLVSILRVGKIAGSTTSGDGAGFEFAWLRLLISTSKRLRMVPKALPDLDWIPLDKLAAIVKEIINTEVARNGIQVYNIVNPRSRPWWTVQDVLHEHFGKDVSFVHLREWLIALKSMELRLFPVLSKILEPMSTQKCSTEKARQASPTLSRRDEVSDMWLRSWLRESGA